MSFTPNIPTTGQSLGITKQPIQDNFTAINTTIAVNHVAINASGQGKHKFLQMPTQGTSIVGSPATASNEIGLYSRSEVGVDLGMLNLYYKFQNQLAGVGNDVPLTRFFTPVQNANGATFIPGGFILQWGNITGAPIANGAPVSFLPGFTTVYSAYITGETSSTDDKTINITAGSLTTSGFTVICSGSSLFTKLYWFAIGI